ncbi:MAG: TonB-dependent receptor [Bacteroidetes bacterium]|nr:TonB-dependent receptor [Bacteroidota bacterium]
MPFKTNALWRGCVFLLCLLLSTPLFAQKTVTGKILSKGDNQPIPAATIQVKGTKSATQSDANGLFSVRVPDNATLVISAVGFDKLEVPVAGRTSLGEITLATITSALNEIVVTGYSTQKKKDITGSVAIVNVKDMKAIPSGSPEQMLQGQASGVTIITSGAPGGPTNVFVRGVTSFGNTDPLYIIDGVPGGLHDLNANDIETLQVLKDAGASSIYGVRGSNGVVIITTKRGKAGRSTITYDGYYGTQRPLGGNPFHLLNSQELANALWKAEIQSGQVAANGNPTSEQYGNGATPVLPDYITPGGAHEGDASVDPSLYNVDYSKGDIYQITKANKQGTNWFHELFRPALIQSHTLAMSGGSEKSTYYFSLGYFDQQGTLLETYLKRYSAKINTTFNVKKNVRVGENAYIFFKSNPQIGYFQENVINYDYREQPIIPVYDIKGNYAGSNGPELGNSPNPVANQLRTSNNRGYNWDIFGNAWAEVDFLQHFTARTSFGGTVDNGYYYQYTYHTYENAENNGSNGFAEGAYYNSSWTWTNTLTYSNTFGKHNLKVLGGTESIRYYGRNVGGTRINYFNDDPSLQVLTAGSPTGQTNASGANQATLASYFGKVDYAYNDRYLFSATIRRDGASPFSPEKRYGNFPAFSAGWAISEESFMKNLTFIDYAKLRGSWGKMGSYANVPLGNAYSQYSATPGNSYYDINGTSNSVTQGFYLSQIGSKVTGWEEDKITNVGLDVVVLHNRLDLSLEYYRKNINGLLFADQAAATIGGSATPNVNIGDVRNNGLDFSATYHGASGSDFKYNLGLVITSYKSNIENIPGAGGYFETGNTRIGNFVRNQVGHPISAFFGYQVDGYFKDANDVQKSPTQQDAAPGRFKYADLNHDGKISDSDRTFFGNPNPKFTYGFNLNATYKNFDATIIFYGSYGNDVVNYTRYWTDFWASFQGNKSQNLLYNSWSASNLNPKAPILENASTFSTNTVPNSFYKESGSFFKCRSAVIGYTLSPEMLKKAGIDKFRVYVQGANLFTITKYTGLDPELSGTAQSFGMDFGNYPNNQKNFIVGVNLSF